MNDPVYNILPNQGGFYLPNYPKAMSMTLPLQPDDRNPAHFIDKMSPLEFPTLFPSDVPGPKLARAQYPFKRLTAPPPSTHHIQFTP